MKINIMQNQLIFIFLNLKYMGILLKKLQEKYGEGN